MWGKKTKAEPLRGFTDDGEDVTEANRLTAQQKVNFLELMLGQIPNYCPIIARNTSDSILQELISSTSLTFIWNPMKDLKTCTSG